MQVKIRVNTQDSPCLFSIVDIGTERTILLVPNEEGAIDRAEEVALELNAHDDLLAACRAALEDCEQDGWENSPLGLQLKVAIARAEGR